MTDKKKVGVLEDRMFMARVSEQAGKYDDMFLFIKELIASKT